MADNSDASLTVATRSRARQGRGAPATRVEYAREWGKYGKWCRPPAVDGRRERWLDPNETSPEQLRDYAKWLISAGAAPGTIRKAMAAIESNLRSRGLLVPDSVPAQRLLRDYEDTRAEAGRGVRRADPLLLDDLLRMLAELDPGSAVGQRDAAILHLLFAGLKVSELSRLTLGQFAGGIHQVPDRLEPVTLVLGAGAEDTDRRRRPAPARTVLLLHWQSFDGRHDPRLCPVEAVLAWYTRIAARDGWGPSWPYLWPVDTSGRIGGLDVRWSGRVGHGLSIDAVRRAFDAAVARACLGVDDGRRVVPQSLRVGGAATKLAQGMPGLGPFAAGGWSPTSQVVVRMLEAYTPDGADRVALTVPGAAREGIR